MNNLAKLFLESPSEDNAFNLVRFLRQANLFHSAILIGRCLSKMYPHNPNIRSETAVSAFYGKKYELSYDLYKENIDLSFLNEKHALNQRINQCFSTRHILDRYNHYNASIVRKIKNRSRRPFPLVTLTITSCKRYDLFEQTMNSFINCCTDIH